MQITNLAHEIELTSDSTNDSAVREQLQAKKFITKEKGQRKTKRAPVYKQEATEEKRQDTKTTVKALREGLVTRVITKLTTRA